MLCLTLQLILVKGGNQHSMKVWNKNERFNSANEFPAAAKLLSFCLLPRCEPPAAVRTSPSPRPTFLSSRRWPVTSLASARRWGRARWRRWWSPQTSRERPRACSPSVRCQDREPCSNNSIGDFRFVNGRNYNLVMIESHLIFNNST